MLFVWRRLLTTRSLLGHSRPGASISSGAHRFRSRVAWLINAEFPTARQPERREQSPARAVHRVTGDALLLHLRDQPFDIVAHQIEPVNVVTVRGMYGDFRRCQAKDQPAVAHVNMRQSEDVPQEGP